MDKLRSLLLLILIFSVVSAEAKTLSSEAKLSLLTAEPGPEMYQLFGHSAIHLEDPENNLDLVFNWGTFDFETPNFTLRFMRGQLDYCLSVDPYIFFPASYERQGRPVYKTELLMTQEEKQRMFDLMMENAQEENRFYRYDFFLDNCATRIQVLLDSVYKDKIIWNPNALPTGTPYRNLIDPYIQIRPYIDLGIDICLGLPTDRKATAKGTMFLPDHLMRGIQTATILRNGREESLSGVTTQIVFTPRAKAPEVFFKPWMLASLIFLVCLIVSIIEKKLGTYWGTFDLLFFLFISLLGVLMFTLWFGTEHKATPFNFNLLWAWPTTLFVLPWIRMRYKPLWLKKYFGSYALIIGLLLLSWIFLPQELHPAIIPLVMAIGLRAVLISWRVKSKLTEPVAPSTPQ